jgi:hypothetical protein
MVIILASRSCLGSYSRLKLRNIDLRPEKHPEGWRARDCSQDSEQSRQVMWHRLRSQPRKRVGRLSGNRSFLSGKCHDHWPSLVCLCSTRGPYSRPFLLCQRMLLAWYVPPETSQLSQSHSAAVLPARQSGYCLV